MTPEKLLLHEFRLLFEAQPKSLRGLAIASGVGVETIRGWKDQGRFPRSSDDFMKVVQTCLKSLDRDASPRLRTVEEWAVRYHEARREWENRTGDRRTPTPAPATSPGRPQPPPVQIYGGDYVHGVKNSLHVGDVNHITGQR